MQLFSLSAIATDGVAEFVVRFFPRTWRELRRNVIINWKLRTKQLHLQKRFKIASSEELLVRIVSLKRSSERTNLTAESCRKQGVKFEVFDAVDGLDRMNDTEISIFAGRKKRRRLDVTKYVHQEELFALYKNFDGSQKRGYHKEFYVSLHERLRFGCYMSHISLWREMLSARLSLLIILEDDVIVENEFLASLRAHLSSLPANWGLLYLNGCFRQFGPKWDSGLWVSRGGLCTYGYVISSSAAESFLQSAAIRSDKPLDHMMDEEVLSGRIMAFHAEPPLVKLKSGLNSTLKYLRVTR